MSRILSIGIGLGGCKLALEMKKNFSNGIDSHDMKFGVDVGMINISQQELSATANTEVGEEHQIVLGSDVVFGAGKDRETGLNYFANHDAVVTIMERIASWVEHDTQFIFVNYTTGGGTGSAGGPIVIGILNSEDFRKLIKPTPIIIGLAMIPDRDEGVLSYGNTLGCINHMDKLIDAGYGRFMLIRNEYSNEKGNDLTNLSEKQAFINKEAIDHIREYLTSIGASRLGCLDFSDRYRALKQSGLHSIERFTGERKMTPFISPESQPVKMTMAQIPENLISVVERDVVKLQHDDYKIGYIDSEEVGYGLIHRAGCNSIKVLTSDLRDHFDTCKARSLNARESDQKRGETLTNLAEEKTYIKETYGETKAGSLDSIIGLLD